jgi:hypothetical protein
MSEPHFRDLDHARAVFERGVLDPSSFARSACTHGAPQEPAMSERNQSAVLDRQDLYVSKYVGIHFRSPSAEELSVRETAKNLKIPTAEAVARAAPAMARLIDGPCFLVPVPASSGNLYANLILAHAIAVLVNAARVIRAVCRDRPVESSARRRMVGLPGLSVRDHHIIRSVGPLDPLPLYFVDNVVTTGTTIEACRQAVGWGIGLAYADASTRNTLVATEGGIGGQIRLL